MSLFTGAQNWRQRVRQQQGDDVSAQRGAVNLGPAAARERNAEGKRQRDASHGSSCQSSRAAKRVWSEK